MRPHDHAGDAIPALRCLLVDKGLLKRTGFVSGPEPFDGNHAAASDQRNRDHAGIDGLAIEHDRARPALSKAAAELGPIQGEVVAQHIEKRGLRLGVDLVMSAIDV